MKVYLHMVIQLTNVLKEIIFMVLAKYISCLLDHFLSDNIYTYTKIVAVDWKAVFQWTCLPCILVLFFFSKMTTVIYGHVHLCIVLSVSCTSSMLHCDKQVNEKPSCIVLSVSCTSSMLHCDKQVNEKSSSGI